MIEAWVRRPPRTSLSSRLEKLLASSFRWWFSFIYKSNLFILELYKYRFINDYILLGLLLLLLLRTFNNWIFVLSGVNVEISFFPWRFSRVQKLGVMDKGFIQVLNLYMFLFLWCLSERFRLGITLYLRSVSLWYNLIILVSDFIKCLTEHLIFLFYLSFFLTSCSHESLLIIFSCFIFLPL